MSNKVFILDNGKKYDMWGIYFINADKEFFTKLFNLYKKAWPKICYRCKTDDFNKDCIIPKGHSITEVWTIIGIASDIEWQNNHKPLNIQKWISWIDLDNEVIDIQAANDFVTLARTIVPEFYKPGLSFTLL